MTGTFVAVALVWAATGSNRSVTPAASITATNDHVMRQSMDISAELSE
jgi:hypothetical protein